MLYPAFALHAKQSDSRGSADAWVKNLLPSPQRSLPELWFADVKFKPFPEGPSVAQAPGEGGNEETLSSPASRGRRTFPTCHCLSGQVPA